MDALGFIWNPYDVLWEEGFSVLMIYKNEQGDFNVPYNHKLKKFNLGQWVSDQRKLLRKGTMPEDRAKRLEDLGFEW